MGSKKMKKTWWQQSEKTILSLPYKLAISVLCIASPLAIHANETRLEATIQNRVETLGSIIIDQQRHLRLDIQEQTDLLRTLNSAITQARGRGQDTPPRPPPRAPQITVVGKVQNILFAFRGQTIAEIHNQCSDFMLRGEGRKLERYDRIYFSTNATTYKELKTPAWWREIDLCDKIYEAGNGTPLRRMELRAEGLIKSTPFSFRGSSYDEVFNSCVDQLEARPIDNNKVDLIYTSINGARREKLTTPGWWVGSFEICRNVLKGVPQL
jgi:hypothetical protein